MRYNTEDLKMVQKTEVEILEEIIRVCKENNLTYFTYGGTTLGTIRHHGFIPWDDDIDLGMMRDDFERFLEIAPQKLRKGYYLQHFKIDNNTPTYFAKVRKDGTLFVEDNNKHLNIHKGIFVDIMPFDFIPDTDKEMINHNRKITRLMSIYGSKSTFVATSERNKTKKVLKDIARKILHVLLIPISKKYLYEKLDIAMRKYNSSPTKRVGASGLKTSSFFYDDLFPLQPMTFEDVTVMAPHNPDAILSIEYGDYMKLPPIEKRYTHAPIILKY